MPTEKSCCPLPFSKAVYSARGSFLGWTAEVGEIVALGVNANDTCDNYKSGEMDYIGYFERKDQWPPALYLSSQHQHR